MKTRSTFQLVDYTGQDRVAPVVVISFESLTNTYRATCVVCGADETSSEPFPDDWARGHWPPSVHVAGSSAS